MEFIPKGIVGSLALISTYIGYRAVKLCRALGFGHKSLKEWHFFHPLVIGKALLLFDLP